MLYLEDVSLQFGDRILFDEVSLNLTKDHRYILVGANGAGKSSFFSLLARETTPTLGNITQMKGKRLGALKQDQHLYDNSRIIDVVLRGRKELWETFEAKEKLLTDEGWTEASCAHLEKLDEKIERLDGYRAEALAAEILTGLGIKESQHEDKLKTLSGGWKIRVLLAQLLFDEPEILLLDEPTNYLDWNSIRWLEGYLINDYPGMIIATSHDQTFLENVGTCVLDLDYGEIRMYPCSYQTFLMKKVEVAEQKTIEYQQAEKKVAKMERFIERFRGTPTKAAQVRSRSKMIERVEWPELGRSSRRSPRFSFQIQRVSGRIACHLEDACVEYENGKVLGPYNLELHRGERLAIIGPNGVGKTTLVQLIIGRLEAAIGMAEVGHAVEIAEFSQEHKHLFTGKDNILDWFRSMQPGYTEERLRATLGALLFSADDLKKKVSMLSGGEMARLLLGTVMLKKANFLVLDEPTNHLDLEARQALAETLSSFQGTVLFVSHDRHFVEAVATKVMDLTPKE